MTHRYLALLATTALIAPTVGHAQNADTACTDLEGMIVAGVPEDAGDSDDLMAVVETGDGDACLVELTRISEMTEAEGGATVADTAQTTLRLEDEVTVAGRVLLEQTAPRVDVQEGETDVEIEPGAPTVTVAEGQAEIVVRQAPANVTIDMPVPTIRIEQAAPEIIITMPDPNVTVGAAQPQVRVVQADPVVTVTQAPPGVQLELSRVEEGAEGGFDVSDARSGLSYRAGDTPEEITTEDAEVNVTRGEPRVVMTEPTEQAQVQIERAEPMVRFEQAEPVVNFASAGEPQVEFTQSGEPTVTFQQAGDAGAAQEGETDAAALTAPAETDATEQAEAPVDADAEAPEAEMADAEVAPVEDAETVADTDATVETETPVEMAGPAVEREGYNLAQTGEYEVNTLVGSTLYGVNDESIGDIGDLVVGTDGQVSEVLVEVGGFLGLGEKGVMIPFDRLSVLRSDDGDIRAYIDATEEELEAMPAAQ